MFSFSHLIVNIVFYWNWLHRSPNNFWNDPFLWKIRILITSSFQSNSTIDDGVYSTLYTYVTFFMGNFESFFFFFFGAFKAYYLFLFPHYTYNYIPTYRIQKINPNETLHDRAISESFFHTFRFSFNGCSNWLLNHTHFVVLVITFRWDSCL